MILTYKKNLIFSFLKNIFNISVFFFSLILILNILQEIIFFKDLDVDFFIPIYLTTLNASSVLFDVFPFIFLIGAMNFFIEILDRNELIIYKSYGLSNLKIISVVISTSFFLGIFLSSIAHIDFTISIFDFSLAPPIVYVSPGFAYNINLKIASQ